MVKSKALIGKERNTVIWDGNVWEDPTYNIKLLTLFPQTQVFITSEEIVSKFLAEDVSQPEKINLSLSVKSAVNSPEKCQVK